MAINLDSKSLLRQYGQAKQLEIERLLSQYGTSLKETREMYPQLTTAIEQRRLATTFPTQPLFFTSYEAAQMGLKLDEGWMLKFTPKGKDYSISFVNPQKWEITERGTYISPEGAQYSQADLEALLSVPTGGLEATTRALSVEDLTEEGKTLYQEYQAGGGELGVADWIDLRERQQLETEEVFGAVFPEQDIEEVIRYMQEKPEDFLADLREIGRTPETEALLRAIYPEITEEDMYGIFGLISPVEESKATDLWQKVYLWGASTWHGVKQFFLTELPQKILRVIAGEEMPIAGPLITVPAPGGMEENIVSQWAQTAIKNLQADYDRREGEFQQWLQAHPELLPREEWAKGVVETITENPRILLDPAYVANLMIEPALFTATFIAGASLGTLVTGNPALGAMAGVGITTPMITHDLYNDIIESGGTHDQAAQLSMPLGLAISSVEIVGGMPVLKALFPQFFKQFTKNASSLLVRRTLSSLTARGLKTFAHIEISETLEEVIQEVMQNAAVKTIDENRSIFENMPDVVLQTLIATLPLAGLGGGTHTSYLYRNFSQEQMSKIDEIKGALTEAGIEEQQAELIAVGEVLQTPEGQEALSKTVDDVRTLSEIKRQAQTAISQIQENNPNLVIPAGNLGAKNPSSITNPLETEPEDLFSIATNEDIKKGLLITNWMRTVLKKTERIPGIGRVQRAVLGWRSTLDLQNEATEAVVGRSAVVYGAVTRMGVNTGKIMVGTLRSIITNPVRYFGFNESGYSSKMAGRLLPDYESERANSGTLEHVFTHPEMYDWTRMDKGLEYVTRFNRINEAVFALLNKEGVAPNVVNEAWMHRVVTGRTVEGEVIEARGRPGRTGRAVGAKPSYEKPRTFKTMAEGIQASIEYEPNPEVSIGSYIEEAYKKIAAERVASDLQEFGVTPTERLLERFPEIAEAAERTKEELADAARLHELVLRAKRGEKLPEQTLRAMERRFPELGRRLRALVGQKSNEVQSLRTALAQMEDFVKSLKAKTEEAVKVAKERPVPQIPPDEKLRQAFEVLDYESRLDYRNFLQDKLQAMGEMVSEQEAEIDVLEEELKTDPIATFTVHIGKIKRHLDYFIKQGEFPESFTLKEAAALTMKPIDQVQARTKEGRVPSAYVIDELAEHFNLSEEEMIRRMEGLADTKQRLADLKILIDAANQREEGIKRMLGVLSDVESTPETVEAEVLEPVPEVPAEAEDLQAQISRLETELMMAGQDITRIQAEASGLTDAQYLERLRGLVGEKAEAVPEAITGIKATDVFPEGEYHLTSSNLGERATLKAGKPGEAIFEEEGKLTARWMVNIPQKQQTAKFLSQQQSVSFGKSIEGILKSHPMKEGYIYRPIQTTARRLDLSGLDFADFSQMGEVRYMGNIEAELVGKFKKTKEGYEFENLRRVPVTPPGMPEAGLQVDIFGYQTPVFPKGKGEITQISMEDYNKLVEHYEKEGLPMPHVNVKPKVEGVSELSEETQFMQMSFEVPEVMSSQERKVEFDKLASEAKTLMEARKAPYWQARAERAAKMRIVEQPGIGEGYLPMPFAGGRIFNQDLIDACNKFFGREPGSSILSFTSDAASILRITKAALDFSAMAIQGLASFGLAHTMLIFNPVIGAKMMGGWYKALGLSTAAFFRGDVFYSYMEKNQDAMLQRVNGFGGTSRAIDYFDVLKSKQGIGRLSAWLFEKIPLKPFERAELAFYSAGEIVRTEMWKALSPKAIKQGKGFELARHLDILTGISDSQAAGVPLTMRQLESSFMWFAPNYTRACLSLLADVFRGGYTGAQARKALGGLLGAGVAYYIGIQFAMAMLSGKDEDDAWEDIKEGLGIIDDPITGEVTWRPTSRLMTIKIGNYYFGIGGFWYGLVRLVGNIGDCINEVGNRERIDLIKILEGNLPNRDNPFVYWWYSRSSPLVGTGIEIATNSDFLGYPISVDEEGRTEWAWENPAMFAEYLISRFEPIWMEQGLNWMIPGLVRDYEIPEDEAKALVPIFEIFGWRTFPESSWVKFYDKVEEYIKQIPFDELDPKQIDAWNEGKLGWGELTRKQKQDLLQRYPELAELYDSAQSDSKLRDSGVWKAYTDRLDEERAIYYERIDEYTQRLLDGEIDTREYRELCSEAGQNYGAIMESIERDPTYKEIYEYFDKRQAEGVKYEFRWDLAYTEYNSLIRFADDPAMYLPNGDYNWDERDRRIADFIDKWGVDLYNEILDYINTEKEEKGLNPVWLRKGQDSEKLSREYWNLPYKPISEMTEEDYNEGNIPAEYYPLWKQYQGIPDTEKEGFLELHPELSKDWRAEYRKNHPEEDAMLALWGYGGKIQSMETYNLLRQWGKELGVGLENMGLGLPPQSLIEDYFGYGEVSTEFSGNSAEAKLWRLNHPDFTNWAMENWGWEGTEDYKGIEYYQLQVKWREKENEYNAIEGDEARQQFLEANRDYWTARLTMQAYDYEVPEDYINLYVEYYQMPVAGYDQERFLMEHEDYYKDVWLGVLENQPKDFSKIPTEKEESLLSYYDNLPTGSPRLQARCKDAELDAALVRLRGLEPAYGTYRCGEGQKREEKTPWEEAAEVEEFKEKF